MSENTTTIKAHWDAAETQSMYDKHWAAAERNLILPYIPSGAFILDAGCGEGEGTQAYASLPGVDVHAIDYSATRLKLARERCALLPNAFFTQCDLLQNRLLPNMYDCVISVRLLVNFKTWDEQRTVLDKLIDTLKPGGRLLLMEGSKEGQEQLNAVRRAFGMPDITEQWHNLFLEDKLLADHLTARHMAISAWGGFGAFFLLTRGVQPALVDDPNRLLWHSAFNERAASQDMQAALPLGAQFSRIRLWVATKHGF